MFIKYIVHCREKRLGELCCLMGGVAKTSLFLRATKVLSMIKYEHFFDLFSDGAFPFLYVEETCTKINTFGKAIDRKAGHV